MTVIVDLGQDVKELTPRMIALRRQPQQHPELAFEEVWTAALAARMRALGFAVHEEVAGTGVLAVLEGTQPGRTLLVRADMHGSPDPLAAAVTAGSSGPAP